MDLKARYCIVFGCLNSNKHIQDLSFFSLPKDVDRREEWLVAVGREDLLKREELKVKSYLVCATHFEESVIKNIRQLKPEAVPTRFLPKDTPQPANHEDNQSEDPLLLTIKPNFDTVSVEIQEVSTSSMKTIRNSKLVNKTPQKRKLLKDALPGCKQKRLDEMTGNNCKTNNATDCIDEETISRRLNKLVELGNKIESKFNHNDAEYKAFALKLHSSSPHTYRWLQPLLKLPSKSVINSFEIKIPVKFDDQVLQSLSLKLKSLPPKAKYCTISIGMLALKRNLYYNTKTDEVIGFHNINGSVLPQTVNKACVMMLQSISFNWNQPIAYAFLGNTKQSSELDKWINKVIRKLNGVGFKVMALISDHKSNFNKYATLMKNVTKEKPYFVVDDRKIYFIFDVPNLIKSVRDQLLAEDFHYEGKLISWDHIKELYAYEKENELRLMPKITNAHVEPNKIQRRKLKFATQIFSHTMYAALETYIDFGKITDDARATAKFIKTMNGTFDILNSFNINTENKTKAAFLMSDEQVQILEDGHNMLANIRTSNHNNAEHNANDNILFENFQISIQSIQLLFKDLKTEGFEYIFTGRLNQDDLENLFRDIKQQGSPGSELTPFKFTRAFSKLYLNKMLNTIPPDNDESDINDILMKTEDIMNNITVNILEEDKPSLVALHGQIDYRIDLPEDNTLLYIASYLFYKCSTNHTCDAIVKLLKSAPCLDKSTLGHYQEYNKSSSFYGHLRIPPTELNKYVDILETYFANNFEKCIYNRPGSTIFRLLTEIPLPKLPCPCFPIEYFLQLFVRLRIFTTIKYNNCSFKASKRSTKQYLKVKPLSIQ